MSDVEKQVSDIDEDRVQHYFRGRHFTVERLDTQGHSGERCDFEVSKQGISFLCEVKSILSILPGEMDYRSTFRKEILERFEESPVRTLPYLVTISTHQAQLPPKHAREKFLDWLETTLLELDPSNDPLPSVLHHPWESYRQFDLTRMIEVDIEGQNGPLEFMLMTGGSMGYEDKIWKDTEKAISQLNTTVTESEKKYDPRIPRVVVLSSHVGPPILYDKDMPTVAAVMKNHSELSAMVVLGSVPVEQPKAPRVIKKFSDIAEGERVSRKSEDTFRDAFLVFHNPYLTKADPLDITVFDDGLSDQYEAERIKQDYAAYCKILGIE